MHNTSLEAQQFLNELEHPLLPVIQEIRKTILNSRDDLSEDIKWKAPSFSTHGTHWVTLKLYPAKSIQVIFHRDAQKRAPLSHRLIDDSTGLLKWRENDRAMATFTDLKMVQAQASELAQLVNLWVDACHAHNE